MKAERAGRAAQLAAVQHRGPIVRFQVEHCAMTLNALTFALLSALALSLSPALAAKVTLDVAGASAATRNAVSYECGAGHTVPVQYVNVGSNALAVLPVGGQTLVFVGVLSGSGARYASGPYIWWNKGRQASLFDERAGANAPPLLSCSQTP
jgi:membrane-bound inhibitor of C-type lysozyme